MPISYHFTGIGDTKEARDALAHSLINAHGRLLFTTPEASLIAVVMIPHSNRIPGLSVKLDGRTVTADYAGEVLDVKCLPEDIVKLHATLYPLLSDAKEIGHLTMVCAGGLQALGLDERKARQCVKFIEGKKPAMSQPHATVRLPLLASSFLYKLMVARLCNMKVPATQINP